jgi:hypothetical protein
MALAALVYSAGAAGVNTVNLDFSAATDPDFSIRNSHYIFTEPYKLLGTISVGASLTRGRFQVPTWNAIGEFTLWRANRSANVPANPQADLFLNYPADVPQNEEFQVQWSNNLGASTEQEQTLILLGTQDYNQNIPRGRLRLNVRATATVTPTVNAWSGPVAITLSQSLRGGVYSVVGMNVQGTNSAFWRIIFPRYRLYHGRKLRPGWVVQTAVGDVPFTPIDQEMTWPGELGRFHTFELPAVEFFGITAGSTTYQIFMDLVYLGEDVSQLSQGLGGGM